MLKNEIKFTNAADLQHNPQNVVKSEYEPAVITAFKRMRKAHIRHYCDQRGCLEFQKTNVKYICDSFKNRSNRSQTGFISGQSICL